jgi:signal transduction histidine kinase
MTDPGSISIEVGIEGEHLLIRIEDTGPGMGPDVLEQIFDPFFTTKGGKGTGLGLSIVKTIVEAHRGTIECQSALGKGTTFILRLRVR